MSGNFLSGQIPTTVGELASLKMINLNANYLEGLVPWSISLLPNLTSLLLYQNSFTGFGNLTDSLAQTFVNPLLQTQLTTIGIGRNLFSGTIPAEIFLLPNLLSLAALDNCWVGDIPPQICNATKLESLILDGLTGGSSCKKNVFPWLANLNFPSKCDIFQFNWEHFDYF